MGALSQILASSAEHFLFMLSTKRHGKLRDTSHALYASGNLLLVEMLPRRLNMLGISSPAKLRQIPTAAVGFRGSPHSPAGGMRHVIVSTCYIGLQMQL